jgi:hypothetical protein
MSTAFYMAYWTVNIANQHPSIGLHHTQPIRGLALHPVTKRLASYQILKKYRPNVLHALNATPTMLPTNPSFVSYFLSTSLDRTTLRLSYLAC